jgi:hypothetical protein
MFSTRKLFCAVLTASALLLCTSPLSAALRSKTGYTSVKAHSVAHLSRQSSSTRAGSHHSETAAGHSSTSHGSTRHSAHTVQAHSSKARFHGQQSIDSARTLEIQQALVREHYLQGEPTGEWDQATREALIRFQTDNHWQTKVLPDARALIKLGLGPSQQNLLNPETAAMAMPNQSGGLGRSAQSGAN